MYIFYDLRIIFIYFTNKILCLYVFYKYNKIVQEKTILLKNTSFYETTLKTKTALCTYLTQRFSNLFFCDPKIAKNNDLQT